MVKNLILSIFMAIFLVACGQGELPESSEDVTNEVDIENTETEKETSEEKVDTNEEIDAEETSDEQAEKTNVKVSEENEADTTNTIENLAELQVHYIDVGQADATLLQYGKHNILFDAGDWRGSEVVSYLKSQGVKSLDLVIGSHPDADHIGQLDDVMNAFSVTEVWLSGNASSSNTFQRGLEAVLTSGANYHEPRSGEVFDIGPMNLKVLYPQSITGASNEESISVLFTYGNVKFLFTGDADRSAEKQMMNSGINIDADILHLGHHGSSTSSDPAFIKAVSPKVAIYSASANNSYGHPHREVVSQIQNAGIQLYGTDVHGTIIVTTDGKDYTIKTKKDGTVTPKSAASDSKSSSGSKASSDSGSKSKSSSSSSSSSGSGSSSSSSSGSSSSSNSSSNSNTEAPKSNGSCVNINTASYAEVQRIKHIGPERAQDLIDLRPYNSVNELTRIKGIGDARIRDIVAEGIACVN